jgi:hypothetical protein
LALLGLSGCLLFTDPINKAPTVSINGPSGQVVRGKTVEFTANVSDDKDSPSTLVIEWSEFTSVNPGCDWITKAAWAPPQSIELGASSAPYHFTANKMGVVCVCVRATDHDGASSQACQPVEPVNLTPVVVITDVSGARSGDAQPLCSSIHLSAQVSNTLAGDQLQFTWTMQYVGSDAAGKAAQLVACDEVVSSLTDRERCFYAAGPGTYTVTLTVADTPAGGGTSFTTTSKAATFDIPVSVDTPPCLQRTDPDVYAQRILLTGSTDLGSTYQSRTFKVLSAADDCEPFPSSKQSAQFVWSVYDTTQKPPSWVPQANSTDAFTVSQAMFPNARFGDTIKVRVEARDAAVQKLYRSGISACASDQTDICCGSGQCTGTNDCIRWTTWTVQFQP